MKFLTAAVAHVPKSGCGEFHAELVVTLMQRTDDFRGEPDVLAVGREPYDPYLDGRVREALLTLGILREEENVGRVTGLRVELVDPNAEREAEERERAGSG